MYQMERERVKRLIRLKRARIKNVKPWPEITGLTKEAKQHERVSTDQKHRVSSDGNYIFDFLRRSMYGLIRKSKRQTK